MQLLGHIHEVLGRWLRGQLLLVALVSIVVYVILGPILHLRYALAIGILTGVLEVIPLIGPVVAAAIAATDAFAQSGTQTAIVVIVIYVVLRQVEDQLVMPVVIGRAVHLHPVVTIFAVLVGPEHVRDPGWPAGRTRGGRGERRLPRAVSARAGGRPRVARGPVTQPTDGHGKTAGMTRSCRLLPCCAETLPMA